MAFARGRNFKSPRFLFFYICFDISCYLPSQRCRKLRLGFGVSDRIEIIFFFNLVGIAGVFAASPIAFAVDLSVGVLDHARKGGHDQDFAPVR